MGSTFTLYLPLNYVGPADRRPEPATPARRRGSSLESDRARRSGRWSASPTTATSSQPGDSMLLIVEDDPHYARMLLDLARDNGFKVLVAQRGAEALALASEYQPDGDLARRLPARHARLDAC